jgi:hypothetical protein
VFLIIVMPYRVVSRGKFVRGKAKCIPYSLTKRAECYITNEIHNYEYGNEYGNE